MTANLEIAPNGPDTVVDVNRYYAAIAQFLAYESSLLDQDKLLEWWELLDDDFVYEIPLRLDRTKLNGGNEFASDAYRIRDTKSALKLRIDRLGTGHAWAEEVASRTCRVVGSICVQNTEWAGVLSVRSAVLLYRQRATNTESQIIPAHHVDLIRLAGDRPSRLLKRTVYLTEKSMATTNLAIFV